MGTGFFFIFLFFYLFFFQIPTFWGAKSLTNFCISHFTPLWVELYNSTWMEVKPLHFFLVSNLTHSFLLQGEMSHLPHTTIKNFKTQYYNNFHTLFQYINNEAIIIRPRFFETLVHLIPWLFMVGIRFLFQVFTIFGVLGIFLTPSKENVLNRFWMVFKCQQAYSLRVDTSIPHRYY